MHMLAHAADSFLALFFPQKCALCEGFIEDEPFLCAPCAHLLHFLPGDAVLPKLDKLWFARARSCFAYEGGVAEAIGGLKYHRRFDLLGFFGDALSQEFQRFDPIDLLIPVPLHCKRLASRGFNQSAMLAKRIGAKTKIPVDLFSLQRLRNDPPQVERSAAERVHNVRGAFDIKASAAAGLQGKRTLLIDDVLTTGATANECARALVKAGAERVDVLTIARPL